MSLGYLLVLVGQLRDIIFAPNECNCSYPLYIYIFFFFPIRAVLIILDLDVLRCERGFILLGDRKLCWFTNTPSS